MPEKQPPEKPEPSLRFKEPSEYLDFCREAFCAASVRPSACFDEVWKTAWREHFRHVKMGVPVPFFFAHDVLRILAEPALPLVLNGFAAYGAMMGTVAKLVSDWEASGGFSAGGEIERGRFLAFRPFFHELLLACEIRRLGTVFVTGLHEAEKTAFDGKNMEKWRKAHKPGFRAEKFFGGFFENNRVASLRDDAPEIFERCLGLVRYEMRLRKDAARGLSRPGPDVAADGLSEEDFRAGVKNRRAFRRALWSVACDFDLMDAYKREAARPPSEAALSMPGRFTRPVLGEWEKSGLVQRTLGQGPPPGHPLALGSPRPVVMRLMAENKVPAYLDMFRDREALSTGVVFAVDLDSARSADGPAWGLTGALKLAAFLVADDLLARLGSGPAGAFDVAFMFHDGNRRDTAGVAPRGLAPSVSTTVLNSADFNSGRSRVGFQKPLLFSVPDVFPVLFNHAPGWSGKAVPGPKTAPGGSLEAGAENPAGRLLEQWKGLMAEKRGWGRKISFFMGGPGFSSSLVKSLRNGGSPVFQFITGKSDALWVEARPGAGGERPTLVFGGVGQTGAAKTGFRTEKRFCPYPFQGFRSWALERIFSSKSP